MCYNYLPSSRRVICHTEVETAVPEIHFGVTWKWSHFTPPLASSTHVLHLQNVTQWLTTMSIIITEEDIWKKLQKKLQQFAYIQFYPTNVAQPRMMQTIKMTLNSIIVLIIITHARGFEPIKKYGGQGYLAAPYYIVPFRIFYLVLLTDCCQARLFISEDDAIIHCCYAKFHHLSIAQCLC